VRCKEEAAAVTGAAAKVAATVTEAKIQHEIDVAGAPLGC